METISTYEQQAIDFLTKTNTEIETKFKENNFHFDGDKHKRDIYTVTIKRGGRKMVFSFGQSIIDSQYFQDKNHQNRTYTTDGGERTGGYKITRPSYLIDYAMLKKGLEPTAYSILACLTKYDPGTFENFCDEFGYDADSRKAEKTYNTVLKEYKDLCSIFTENEMEELREIN